MMSGSLTRKVQSQVLMQTHKVTNDTVRDLTSDVNDLWAMKSIRGKIGSVRSKIGDEDVHTWIHQEVENGTY